MLRILLIAGLILYVVYKIGSFFFRAGAASQQLRNQQRQHHNNDYAKPPQPKQKYKEGEYVDYEEIK